MEAVGYWSTVHIYPNDMEAQWLAIRDDGAGWWMRGNVFEFDSYRFFWREPRTGMLELRITGYQMGAWSHRRFRPSVRNAEHHRRTVRYDAKTDYNAVGELTTVLELSPVTVPGFFWSERFAWEGSRAPRSGNPWATVGRARFGGRVSRPRR
ncbi:hypothetical protein EDD27_7835 [Nonomuraea polychroma]|uniref:Uncharacterized protein n=1 Tax=Nonomuraea polychroma TaxID=46176 RepID=A0A438MHL3_9ACTN|nr:hypothetical protein [Nonomuraea polychroma]RVX45058.1 hypothetical protein EDD27_7835 [Nonomuraea polychroma]